jgi:hypothetical protein
MKDGCAGVLGFGLIAFVAFLLYVSMKQSIEVITFAVILGGLLAFIGGGFIYRAFVGYPPAKLDST